MLPQMSGPSWNTLPNEIRLDVLDRLVLKDVGRVAVINQESRSLCLPLLFKVVKLKSIESIKIFLSTVPREYHVFIRDLEVCTKSDAHPHETYGCDCMPPTPVTDTLVELLHSCTHLRQLSMSVGGSLNSQLVPCFARLQGLRRFAISNWADEDRYALSERVVVSLAYALPSLEELSLTRITRSILHAPELIGRFPYIPYVMHDDNVPPHPDLGTDLRLPALLHLPKLRKLRIRDTHLGDPLWSDEAWRERFGSCGKQGSLTEPCALEVLDLGSCPFESLPTNQMFTERILQSVPSSIQSFTLGTALGTSASTSSASRLPHLRTLHLTPLVPLSSIGTTLAQPQISSSPVHTIYCAFCPDDGADGCEALTEFLHERSSSVSTNSTTDATTATSRPQFPSLRRLSVSFSPKGTKDVDGDDFGAVADVDGGLAGMYPPGSPEARTMAKERREATARLRRLCRELSLEVEIIGEEDDESGEAHNVSKASCLDVTAPAMTNAPQQGIWDDGWTGGVKGSRARAMSA